MSKTIYLGVDPGVKGGLAAINQDGSLIDLQQLKNISYVDIWNWISTKPSGYEDAILYACIEALTGYVPSFKGEEGPPGSKMFTLGHSAGILEGFLIVAKSMEIISSYHDPFPATWQALFDLKRDRKNKETTSKWKNRLKQKAQELYPDYANQITLETSDALLIATYCKYYYSSLKGAIRYATYNKKTDTGG